MADVDYGEPRPDAPAIVVITTKDINNDVWDYSGIIRTYDSIDKDYEEQKVIDPQNVQKVVKYGRDPDYDQQSQNPLTLPKWEGIQFLNQTEDFCAYPPEHWAEPSVDNDGNPANIRYRQRFSSLVHNRWNAFCKRKPPPSDPNIHGGQCFCVEYHVYYTTYDQRYYANGNITTTQTFDERFKGNFYGPLISRVTRDETDSSGIHYFNEQLVATCPGQEASILSLRQTIDRTGVSDSNPNREIKQIQYADIRVVRTDGLPDTCHLVVPPFPRQPPPVLYPPPPNGRAVRCSCPPPEIVVVHDEKQITKYIDRVVYRTKTVQRNVPVLVPTPVPVPVPVPIPFPVPVPFPEPIFVSVPGPPGPPGPPGRNGRDGKDGKDGRDAKVRTKQVNVPLFDCDENGKPRVVSVPIRVLVADDGTDESSQWSLIFSEIAKLRGGDTGCGDGNHDVAPSVIATGYSSEAEQVFTYELPSGCKAVILIITGSLPPSLSLYKTSAEGEVEAKFGNIGFAVPTPAGSLAWTADPGWVWTRRTFLREAGDRTPTHVKLSLKPRLNFVLYDAGER